MRNILTILALAVATMAMAQTKRVYINAGHGGWSPNDRPMATIPYPMTAETGRPDTCGFYESNTNLWKANELQARLKAAGTYRTKMSRTKNGPYPWVSGAPNETRYDRPLAEISAEVDAWNTDLFISIHSNAAADGAIANYPLFLYRGLDTEEGVSGSRAFAETLWPYHIENYKAIFDLWTAYKSSMNIRGDRNFYNYTWQNDKGYFGYLGVLMHGAPGILSEGYFHTYRPARHRALNADWCRMEGHRYFRGIQAYFGGEPETTGCIMGDVHTKNTTMASYGDKFTNDPSQYAVDQYLPVNGAEIHLTDANYNVLKKYTVDQNFNGVFVFTDLEPGAYYIALRAEGYGTIQTTRSYKVTVKAGTTVYKHFYLTKGTTTDWEDNEVAIETVRPDEEPFVDHQTVRVYDASGRLVATTTRLELEQLPLPTGIYTLESRGKSVKWAR